MSFITSHQNLAWLFISLVGSHTGVYASSSSLSSIFEAGLPHGSLSFQGHNNTICPTPGYVVNSTKTSLFESRHMMYKYDQVYISPAPETVENPSLGGFTKQSCYPHPELGIENYCVYANPTFNDNRGMVLFIRPSYLKVKLEEFSIFKPDSTLLTATERKNFPYTLQRMPSKGGLGAVANQNLQVGDLVVSDYSLVVVYAHMRKYSDEFWTEVFKFMVDLLPLKGRELFARQHGVGNTEATWIFSAFQRNVFSSPQDDGTTGGFAFVPEPACSLSTTEAEASDSRLKTIHELDDTLTTWEEASLSVSPPTPEMAEHLIDLYKLEKLDILLELPHTIAALAYNSFGFTHEARKHAALAISYGSHTHAANWLDGTTHLDIISQPEKHWSYRIRTLPADLHPRVELKQ
ncbi:hypothetical protein O181_004458 [Austropuccinia psidii MF-1]|uniref:Uncharacterized protein n=1 Tax=Austropuccinia psidii MF-1 TaxID=1389203 RepID=A0A9Q3BGM1_9BASI|nr:hypothetical protein [Austropuccinia psidii MF-1]